MKTLKDVREGLEKIVRTVSSNQKGNMGLLLAVGIGMMAGIITAYASVGTPKIQDVQPYADGRTVQGVVQTEQFGSADGKYFGVPGATVNGYELVVKAPDGRCYKFGTAAASESGLAISELEKEIEPGTEVVVKDFNPDYRGTTNCNNVRYSTGVTPAQIEVITK